jgi:transposase-like protein
LFHPTFCPNPCCDSELRRVPFRYRKRGSYHRKCDGRTVPRFLCLVCMRGFSRQTFRANYRHRLPTLNYQLIRLLYSKVTRRQAARVLGVNRKTVERRYRRLARVGRDFHVAALDRCRAHGGIRGVFQLDELETFEHNRRIKPVTLAVLMEKSTYFVLGADAGTLPARGKLSPAYQRRKQEIEAVEGKRRSQSRKVVRKSLERLAFYLHPWAPMHLQSDRKRTYPVELQRAAGGRRVRHETISGRARRNYSNLIFPVNHTLALMRDGLSCLVRRSWAASKKRSGLQRHCWIWMAWRNYVRMVTNEAKVTPAQALGVSARAFEVTDVFRWRWPKRVAG